MSPPAIQPERATQNRVVALFSDGLGYDNLGNWIDRVNNRDIEDGLLKAYLTRKKYTPAQKILIGRTAQIARLIRALSEIRFLNDDATLRPEIQESVDAAEELLDELGA